MVKEIQALRHQLRGAEVDAPLQGKDLFPPEDSPRASPRAGAEDKVVDETSDVKGVEEEDKKVPHDEETGQADGKAPPKKDKETEAKGGGDEVKGEAGEGGGAATLKKKSKKKRQKSVTKDYSEADFLELKRRLTAFYEKYAAEDSKIDGKLREKAKKKVS